MTITAESFVFDLTPGPTLEFKWGCVAGGYVRDAILGVDYTDVDLFLGYVSSFFSNRADTLPYLIVNERTGFYIVSWCKSRPDFGAGCGIHLLGPSFEYDEGAFISYHVEGIPALNVILRNVAETNEHCPKDLVSKFHCTLSACWIEDGKLHTMPGFDSNVENGDGDFHPFVSQRYEDKMRDKFPKRNFYHWRNEEPYRLLMHTGSSSE